MMDGLKKCPFCGGDPVVTNEWDSRYGRSWYIKCNDCDASGAHILESMKEFEPEELYGLIEGAVEKAKTYWNIRIAEDADK